MTGLALLLIFAIVPGSISKSAREMALAVVPPPGFVITRDEQGHGTAINSKEVRRAWDGPNGISMSLILDDTESIDGYGVTEQRKYAVEQTKENYPEEKLEASALFVVNKKEWILIRTHGDYRMTKYRHFILLTELQGQYITLHFVGAEGTLPEMQGYIEFVMRQVSGAKPDDPITAR